MSEGATLKRRHVLVAVLLYLAGSRLVFGLSVPPLGVDIRPNYAHRSKVMFRFKWPSFTAIAKGCIISAKRKIVEVNETQFFGSSRSTDLRADVLEIPTDWECVTPER